MDLSKLPRLSNSPQPPNTQPSSETPAPASPAMPAGPLCPACNVPVRPNAKFCDSCGAPLRASRSPTAGAAAEAWISIGIGILVLIIYPTMLQYLSSRCFHSKFGAYDAFDASGNAIVDKNGKPAKADYVTMRTTLKDGSESVTAIPYGQTTPNISPNYWSDLAITLFGLALIVEGIALVLSRRTWVIVFALLVTSAAVFVNLGYFFQSYAKYGILPIITAVAVIFGGYMAIYQVQLLRSVRATSAGN